MPSTEYYEFRKLLQAGSHTEALRYAEAESLKRRDANVFWLTQVATANIAGRRYQEAIAACNQALAIAPHNVFALSAKARALLAEERIEEALALYQEVLQYDAEHTRARRGVLECLMHLNRWQQILECLSRWDIPDGDVYRWQVKALAGLERHAEAIEVCHKWLREKPDCPGALWELSELEIKRDGLDAVLTRFKRLARIPSKPPIYGEICASLHRRAGNLEDAITQYQKLAGRDSAPKTRRKEAFALAQSGRESDAMPIFEELLRINPRDVFVHNAYIAACKRVNERDKALQFYQTLMAAFPNEKSLFGRMRQVKK